MSGVEFTDNSEEIKLLLERATTEGLEAAAKEIKAQAVRNTPVKTGQLKGSWDHIVDEGKMDATIGSPLENAIWTEFGTGEYALKGNGRKDGWVYQDPQGLIQTFTDLRLQHYSLDNRLLIDWHDERDTLLLHGIHRSQIPSQVTVNQVFLNTQILFFIHGVQNSFQLQL